METRSNDLFIAVCSNDIKSITYLIKTGNYSLNQKFNSQNEEDDDTGVTALYKAVDFQNDEIVQLLIKEGADTNIICTPFLRTPLMLAVFNNNIKIVGLLLNHDHSNINIKNIKGFNALDIAYHTHPQNIPLRVILENSGAKLNISLDQGAIGHKYNLLIQALKKEQNLKPEILRYIQSLEVCNEKGFCDGLCKLFILYAKQNRLDEFESYRHFLGKLDLENINIILKAIKEKKKYWIVSSSDDSSSYSLYKFFDFMQAANLAWKTQFFSYFKSIQANLDKNYLFKCLANELTYYLKKYNIFKKLMEQESYILLSALGHTMDLVYINKDKVILFFDPNQQKIVLCNTEENVTEAIKKSFLLLDYTYEDHIILSINEISYGNKNRELDDLLTKKKFSAFIRKHNVIIEDIIHLYKVGSLSRQEVFYRIQKRLLERVSSDNIELPLKIKNQLDILSKNKEDSCTHFSDLEEAKNIYKMTLLHIACQIGDFKLVSDLLTNGANLEAHNINDRTPLYYAVFRGDMDLVKLLVGNGAEIEVKDISHQTLIQVAELQKHAEIAKFLKQTIYERQKKMVADSNEKRRLQPLNFFEQQQVFYSETIINYINQFSSKIDPALKWSKVLSYYLKKKINTSVKIYQPQIDIIREMIVHLKNHTEWDNETCLIYIEEKIKEYNKKSTTENINKLGGLLKAILDNIENKKSVDNKSPL